MNDQELENLLDDFESDRAERTSSHKNHDKISQAICALSNDLPNNQLPGIIFIGANDDGSCSGLKITEELLQLPGNLRDSGNILPIPSLDVAKRNLKGGEMLVITVHPSQAPPVRYKGTVWIRVGPRRGIASRDDEIRLNEKRRSKDLPYDLHPIASASLSDLDLELFRQVYLPNAIAPETLEANYRTIPQQLMSLRFTNPNPPIMPTVMGILVIGKSQTDYIPGAYIQFLRIDGFNLTDPIKNNRTFYGPLLDILPKIDDLLSININTSIEITEESQDRQHPDYPMIALQQLVRNAIMHRNYESSNAPVRIYWYTDRIEIYNPGGPFGQVTKEHFGQPGITDYRNPHLAEAMKNMGYVQRFGFGIESARKALRENGNPDLTFEIPDEANHVLVIVRSGK
jgi:ATP-dependent DNA helicase RecG